MAKSKEVSADYNFETKKLKDEGPGRLYLIYGAEDYLTEYFLLALKSVCLPEGDDGFSYKKFDGPELDLTALTQALDAMPFLSERTFLELRNIDLNKLPEPEQYIALLGNIPSYCTVVFIETAGYEPDGRLKLNKFLKEKGRAIHFLAQDIPSLSKWVIRRFDAQNKTIDTELARYFIMNCGDRMNLLIPQIEKIAAYAKGARITQGDIDAVGDRLLEADVFTLIDKICARDEEAAFKTLYRLLQSKENSAFSILALFGYQLRRLYGIRLACDAHISKKEMMDLFHVRYDNMLDRMVASVKKLSLPQLASWVEECVRAEYRLKSTSSSELDVLEDTFFHMLLEDPDAKAGNL